MSQNAEKKTDIRMRLFEFFRLSSFVYVVIKIE